MSQVLQTLTPANPPVTAASGSSPLRSDGPDSGQSFESALADQFADSAAPVEVAGSGAVERPPGVEATGADSGTPPAPGLADTGNLLPFILPPVPVAPAVVAAAGGESPAPTDTAVAPAFSDPNATVLIQPPVVLPAKDGQSFSMPPQLNRSGALPIDASARPSVSESEVPTLLAAEAPATAPAKILDTAASPEVFRAALKNIAPAATDARPGLSVAVSGLEMLSAGSLASTPVNSPTGPAASIPVPLGQAGWGQAFGNQVAWVVNQGMPSAELHLSPPDLGPMSVRISMEQDQASMAFSSPHAMVREAIEAALPRLRDMLGSQGITLVDVNVSQHGSAHTPRDPGGDGNAAVSGRAANGEIEVAAPVVQGRLLGMLDLYA